MKRSSSILCFLLGVLMLGVLSGCQQPAATHSLTVTVGNGGTTDPAPGTHEYDKGASVTVQATAHAGFAFGHWEGDASGNGNPVTLTMDADKAVAAVFTAQGEGEGEGETPEGEATEGEVAEGEGETTEGEGEVVEGEGEPVEGEVEGEGETQRDVGILIDTYMGAESFATDTNPNPIEGRVMAFDAGTIPATLHWVVKNGGGETGGDAAVDGAGAWSATVSLAEGDNLLTFTVPDTPATKTLNLTYTPGYAFGEPLYVTPDVAYLNEDREFTALINLTDTNTNPADVKLLRFDGGTGTEIATLTDTGDTVSGDELAGDGIYAGKFHLNETAQGTLPLRVRVGVAGGGTSSALSEAADIMVTQHWTDEEMNAMAWQIHNYKDQIRSAATFNEMKAVCEQAANELKNDPNVADCGLNPDSWGMWVEYKNGYRAGLAPIVPGYRSGTSTTKTATPNLLSLADKTSSYRKYTGRFTRPAAKAAKPNHPVGSKRVYFLNSYANEFGGFEINITNRLTNYGLDTTGMPIRHLHKIMEHTGVGQYYNVGSYGIIDINTHGTLWGKKESPIVILCSGEYTERETWYYSDGTPVDGADLREDEFKTGELVDLGGDYGITPKFIRRNSGRFPNSLVLANACYSAYNSTMAQAFLDRFAGAYVGYSKPVGQFSVDMDNKLLDTLLASSDNTLADAFVPGQFDPYPGPLDPFESINRAKRAEYRMFGDSALSLPIGLVDGGFENSELRTVWTVTGDARRVGVFGTEFPMEGNGMVLLMPGSSVSQEFVVGPYSTTCTINFRHYTRANSCWTGGTAHNDYHDCTVRMESSTPLGPLWDAPEVFMAHGANTVNGPVLGSCNCDYQTLGLSDWELYSRGIPATIAPKRIRLTISHNLSADYPCTDAWIFDGITVK